MRPNNHCNPWRLHTAGHQNGFLPARHAASTNADHAPTDRACVYQHLDRISSAASDRRDSGQHQTNAEAARIRLWAMDAEELVTHNIAALTPNQINGEIDQVTQHISDYNGHGDSALLQQLTGRLEVLQAQRAARVE